MAVILIVEVVKGYCECPSETWPKFRKHISSYGNLSDLSGIQVTVSGMDKELSFGRKVLTPFKPWKQTPFLLV